MVMSTALVVTGGMYIVSPNARRSIGNIGQIANDIGLAAFAIYQAEGWRACQHLGMIPVRVLDASVYTVAIVIPLLPVGEIWATFRGQ